VGYFAASKGKNRTLLVLEDGVKMPADLGGDIYVRLPDRGDPSSIEASIVRFLDAVL
jgi:hypothetical protein